MQVLQSTSAKHSSHSSAGVRRHRLHCASRKSSAIARSPSCVRDLCGVRHVAPCMHLKHTQCERIGHAGCGMRPAGRRWRDGEVNGLEMKGKIGKGFVDPAVV